MFDISDGEIERLTDRMKSTRTLVQMLQNKKLCVVKACLKHVEMLNTIIGVYVLMVYYLILTLLVFNVSVCIPTH